MAPSSLRLGSSALVALILSLLAVEAGAVKQPDGTPIPQDTDLSGLFSSKGEAINDQTDAAITPQTFTPTCNLNFEVLLRQASYMNSFGWYNVTGNKPTLAEHYEFLSCNDGVGTIKKLDIKNNPNYLGGDIGFYQAVGPCGSLQNHLHIVYSEPKFNPDSNQAQPYIHLLIYNSVNTPKAFYFAWEDLLQGGDNDFSDLVTFVSGISCTGGGGSCQTGQLGICAEGTMQCQQGQLQCLPDNLPATEICDGVDNDCSGVVDEGNLCPEKEVCDKGSCVPKCGTGEFNCPPDKVCDGKGLCVDPDCLQVNCPDGTKCIDGACVAPCDGVSCPWGQVCRVGVCLDPCLTINCDSDQVCELGICVEKCQCANCKASASCQPDGLCIPTKCVDVACSPGFHCDDSGNCVDNCDGAVCPTGEICQMGNCVPDPNSGSGGSGGSGSINIGGEGGVSSSASSSSSSGMGGAPVGPPVKPTVTDTGCGCRVEPAQRPRSALGLLLLAALGAALRRRSSQ